MSKELVEATKNAIGYHEQAGSCAACRHMREVDHSVVSRMWVQMCTLSNICNFETVGSATCNKFEARDTAMKGGAT